MHLPPDCGVTLLWDPHLHVSERSFRLDHNGDPHVEPSYLQPEEQGSVGGPEENSQQSQGVLTIQLGNS